MNVNKPLYQKLLNQERLNFWLTNRIPRVLFTRAMGWLSKVRHPWVARPAIALWKKFSELDLQDSAESEFESLHDCFVRRLKPGARPFDGSRDALCSPCDSIVGTHGLVRNGELLQIKGMVYRLSELLKSESTAQACEGYSYVTLRLTSTMYHHFHAPHDVHLRSLQYVHGDVWNVNPPTLKRVPSLFAKNERAVIRMGLAETGAQMWLVPVAAVLVASMRFTFSDVHLHLGYRGPEVTELDVRLSKGEEMGWFEHGSTIICFVPPGWNWVGPEAGCAIKAGRPLWRRS